MPIPSQYLPQNQPVNTGNVNDAVSRAIQQAFQQNSFTPPGANQAPFAQPGQYNSFSYGQAPAVNPNIFSGYGNLNNQQVQGTNQIQNATNVLDILPQLQSYLSGQNGFMANSQNYMNTLNNAGNALTGGQYNVNLGTNFQGPQQLQNALGGGLDFFGKMGMSQGLGNINLQRNTQNQQLASQLGKQPGNNSLLGVLQGQNNFQSQLAGIPLMGEAQQGTYQRAQGNIDLANQVQNMFNSTQLNQGGFNLNSYLSGLGAYGNSFQPSYNLGGLLSNLAGMQRGIATSETQAGSKNFV